MLAAGGRPRAALAAATLPVAVAAFFRDPVRRPDRDGPPGPDTVLAPADGRVMVAGDPEPGVAPPGTWQQVTIFLALTDVHVNRAPYGGLITAYDYRPGRFRPAFTRAASENERSEIWVTRRPDDADDGAADPTTVWSEPRTVVFRQVVGVLARRIVTRVSVGQRIEAGQRIGLMRFGSRMDVFVPADCTVEVTRGDRVRGGESVLGRWPVGPDIARG